MTDVETPLPLMPNVTPKPTTGEALYRQRVTTGVGITAIIAVLLVLLALTFRPLLLIFMSALFAIGLRGLAVGLSNRTRLSIKQSLGVVTGAIIAITAIATLLLGGQIAAQIDQLAEALPASVDALRSQLQQSGWGQSLLDQLPTAEDLGQVVSSSFQEATGFFSSAVGWLANVVVVLFLTFIFAFDPASYIDNLIRLVPKQRRARAREIVDAVNQVMLKWLLARVLSMIAVGVMTTIGLMLAGAPLALTMGLIAGLLSFIPTFGPIISVVPAALLALLDGPGLALFVIVLYVVVQQIDNFLVTPILERTTVSMPAGLSIIAQLLLGAIGGFVALTLAAPLAVLAAVLVRMLYVEDVLNDRDEQPA